MNDSKFLIEALQGIAWQLPVFVAALVGALITMNRWKDAPSAGVWSLLGFGLAIFLCFAVPLTQAGLRYWLTQNSTGHPSPMVIFGSVTVLWSLLRAASYICLIVAIYAGRPQASEPLR